MRPIPEGWCELADYDDREDSKGSPGRLYSRILCEIQRTNTPIRAYRDGRRWIVNRADAEEFKKTKEAGRSLSQLSIALLDLSEKHASLSSKLFEALSTFINKGEDE